MSSKKKESAAKKEPATKKESATKKVDKLVYLPKNVACKVLDDSHKKFLTIQIGDSDPIMVRRHLVSKA